jgi:REP element-mobilizing transposase RayT
MAYPPRVGFDGAFFHVTCRSVDSLPILADHGRRALFIGILARSIARYGWQCHSYCLMTTHYHLVIETPTFNLSSGMQRLNGLYAREFNASHGRSGHVFERRFWSTLIERESHLLEACRYVALNPVRAGICDGPEAWPWSSYRAIAGMTSTPRFLTIGWLLALFSPVAGEARQAYRAFVAAGLERG